MNPTDSGTIREIYGIEQLKSLVTLSPTVTGVKYLYF